MTSDPEGFRRLQEAGWERVAQAYGPAWASLTTQFVDPLLRAADLREGMKVLDVACGPGYVCEAALRLGALPVGVDFVPAMVLEARRRNPTIEFVEGDAEDLSFPSASWDRVVMNFGILHLARPERSFAEARRVLKRSGRFAFTLWPKPKDNPGAKIMNDAIQAHADTSVSVPEGPDAFHFADEEVCRDALASAGFSRDSVRFETATALWLVPTPGFYFEAERDAGVRGSALLALQTPERLQAIRDAVERGVARHATDGGYSIPMIAHVISAVPL